MSCCRAVPLPCQVFPQEIRQEEPFRDFILCTARDICLPESRLSERYTTSQSGVTPCLFTFRWNRTTAFDSSLVLSCILDAELKCGASRCWPRGKGGRLIGFRRNEVLLSACAGSASVWNGMCVDIGRWNPPYAISQREGGRDTLLPRRPRSSPRLCLSHSARVPSRS